MTKSQEALNSYMNQAASGLMALFGHALMPIGEEKAMALVDDVESGRADIHFKAVVDHKGMVIRGTLIYRDDREIPVFEDYAAHFPVAYKGKPN